MGRERGKKLWEKSVKITDRLDLPTVLAPDVPRLELSGNRSLYMDRHRGVLAYTTEHIDINGGAVIVRVTGRDLQLLAMTDDELRITGTIEKLELME